MSPGGGASSNLANLIVQFVTQGQKEVKQSLDDIQTAISAVVLAVQKFNNETIKALENVKAKNKEVVEQTNKLALGWQTLANTIKTALAASITTITGFVTAGLAAGAMGQILGFQMERLSLTISGMFRPEITKVIDLISQLTDWLQSLTDSQKGTLVQFIALGAAALAFSTGGLAGSVAGVSILGLAFKDLGPSLAALSTQLLRVVEAMQPLIELVIGAITPALDMLTTTIASMSDELLQSIVKWAAAIATFVTILTIIPKVVAAISAVVAAIRAMNVAQVIMLALSGPKGWAQIALGAAAAAAALGVFFEIERAAERVNEKKKAIDLSGRNARGPDLRRTGGFESLSHAYERIALASLRATAGIKDPQKEMVDQLHGVNGKLARIEQNTARPHTVLGK